MHAPEPAIVLAAHRDYFDIDAVREAAAEVGRVYDLFDRRGGSVRVQDAGAVRCDGYEVQKFLIEREDEVELPALLFIPADRVGRCPATLYVDGRGKQEGAGSDGPIARWVREGRIVLSIDVRGFGETADRGSDSKYYNVEQRVSVLALHIGRPLLGQRVEDVLAAMDVLVQRPEVDGSQVDLVGIERAGPVVLHAAALDSRFVGVTVRQSVCSWVDDVVAQPLQPDLIGHVVPSALRRYDLPDLVAAIAPRAVKIEGGEAL